MAVGCTLEVVDEMLPNIGLMWWEVSPAAFGRWQEEAVGREEFCVPESEIVRLQ